jgi:hypothetical protein
MPCSTPCAMQDSAALEVDVLVVGAGASGMTAALARSLDGLDVLLCEKSDRVGGTTATSAGTISVRGSARVAKSVYGPCQRREAISRRGHWCCARPAPRRLSRDRLPGTLTIWAVARALRSAADPWLLCRSTDGYSAPSSDGCDRRIGEFITLDGLMIGRDDIEPLARPFASMRAMRAARSPSCGTRPIACAIDAAPGC